MFNTVMTGTKWRRYHANFLNLTIKKKSFFKKVKLQKKIRFMFLQAIFSGQRQKVEMMKGFPSKLCFIQKY